MDLYRAIRLLAMRSAIKPSQADLVDRIYRWYSRTYFTPLEQAYEIPQEEVLRIYFEDRYLEMRESELEQEKADLLETEEDRQARILKEEEEAYEADQFAQMVAKEEQERASSQAAPTELKSVHTQGSPFAPAPPKNEALLGSTNKEAELPAIAAIPPNITMTFIDEEELQKEIEGFGSMGQLTKNKK